MLNFFSYLCRTCFYATRPRVQSKLLTSVVVVLNPIKVSHLYWSKCLILSHRISLHLHSKSVLSFSRSHSWNGLQHGYRHVEPWLYFSRIIHRIPYLSWREWTRTAVVYHGSSRLARQGVYQSQSASKVILWYVSSKPVILFIFMLSRHQWCSKNCCKF